MSQFEVFMSFYGLLLGLAVAELLGGFAKLVREQQRPRVGWLTPMLGVSIFLQLIGSLSDVAKTGGITLDFDSLALPTLIGVAYFFAAITVVPNRFDGWDDLDAYFFSRRRWTVGLPLGVYGLTIAMELPGVVAGTHPPHFLRDYILLNLALLTPQVIALLARRRAVAFAALAMFTLLNIIIYSATLRPLIWPYAG